MGVLGVARGLGAGGLVAVAAAHANWARGSSWPLADRHQLARTVAGREAMPPPVACLAVAAVLTAGAGLVAGVPPVAPRLGRLGAGAVVAALAARGLVGASGRMPEARACARFAHWDRRLYSPLCLALAGLCAAGLARR